MRLLAEQLAAGADGDVCMSLPADRPRDPATKTTGSGLSPSSDLTGISELFGLDESQRETRTRTATAGRWSATGDDASSLPLGASPDAHGIVHGRYRLIAELGVGGMGVTYRAWDTRAAVPVVVKMPRRRVRHDRDAMERFSREIAALEAVSHEGVVPITDSGVDDGCPFVVMRFLPGGSLADYRRWDDAGRPIRNPPGMLFCWLPGVAAALDHIHSRGMLHRDVKPGNIFLDGFLKPFLGDFGVAKVVDESDGLAKEQTLTMTALSVGTPEYMAPEVFRPHVQPDGRVDQYALAVTVYEMLCGEKPFTGERAHVIVEHSSLPVPPLAERCPGLPRTLSAAIEKALAKNPAERFATCGEFAAAALADLKPLSPEPDTVRLLCPSCRNILKLKSDAAGKSGTCPRCQAAIDVARDLGSLWLAREKRGGGPGEPEPAADGVEAEPPLGAGPVAKPLDARPASAPHTRKEPGPMPIGRLVVAALIGSLAMLLLGLALGSSLTTQGPAGVEAEQRQLERLAVQKQELTHEVERLRAEVERTKGEAARAAPPRSETAAQSPPQRRAPLGEAGPVTWLLGLAGGLLVMLVVISLWLR
jgi:serine/threonine protein kinase